MDAVILAGGDGKRLSMNIPKALLPIKGKTLLQHQIDYLKKFNIEYPTVTIQHKYYELFKNEIKEVCWVVENKKLGTAGAIKNVLNMIFNNERKLKEINKINDFIVLNCDDIVNINLNKMPVNSIAVTNPKLPYGEIELNKKCICKGNLNHGLSNNCSCCNCYNWNEKKKISFCACNKKIKISTIKNFNEKPLLKDKWVSCGWYHFDKNIYKYLPDKGDLERDVFPKMAKKGLLKAFKYTGKWLTINTAKDYEEVIEYYEKCKN